MTQDKDTPFYAVGRAVDAILSETEVRTTNKLSMREIKALSIIHALDDMIKTSILHVDKNQKTVLTILVDDYLTMKKSEKGWAVKTVANIVRGTSTRMQFLLNRVKRIFSGSEVEEV